MTADELAERHAGDRPGFELVSYAEVGLPYWRLRVRCEILARKTVSAIDEILLKAVDADVRSSEDLVGLLGLDEPVLDAAVVGLLGSGWLRQQVDGTLAVTDVGAEMKRELALLRSEDRPLSFDYDGLLRRPALVDRPLEPRQLAAQGRREIPPSPAKRPDLLELRAKQPELERLMRMLGGGRDQDSDLLAVKEILRRERIFREALALVYRSKTASELEVAFLVDDEPSPDHEAAFARAGLAQRLGMDRVLRRQVKPHGLAPLDGVLDRANPDREADLRARLHVARADDAAGVSDAQKELQRVHEELRTLEVRTVEPYEHPQFLLVAQRGSKERLLIVSPYIRDAVVTERFIGNLRKRLDAGAEVRVGYGSGGARERDTDPGAHKKLSRLAADYDRMYFDYLGATPAKVLLSDNSLLVLTSFNWLSFRGDPNRTFRDERGTLVKAEEHIDAEWSRWVAEWPSEP
jgi:hypothetical protein